MFQVEPIFLQSSVPVQSVRLVASPELARAFPCGSLALVTCPDCNLLFNRDFEPQTQHWDPEYEETQACSGHFNRFAEGLVDDLVRYFSLKHKRILEIGCGKGHFLSALCRGGRNIGLGVDPAFDPGRNPDECGAVTFHQRHFDSEHLRFEPDLIVCRHTLEHIIDPESLLTLVASRGNCDIVIEVPDLGRIIAEGAFWDLYYEHCVYYDAESLGTTLNRFGIECHDTTLCFHDQYLLAMGRTTSNPVQSSATRRQPAPAPRFEQTVSAWLDQLERWQANELNILLWGGGSKAVAFLSAMGRGAEGITAVVDINPKKRGRFLPGSGLAVIAPESLTELQPDRIVIMNPAYRSEITRQLSQLGIETQLVDVTRFSALDPVP